MTDREQIRRDAEQITGTPADYTLTDVTLARDVLALLAELEQAERERDEAQAKLDVQP